MCVWWHTGRVFSGNVSFIIWTLQRKVKDWGDLKQFLEDECPPPPVINNGPTVCNWPNPLLKVSCMMVVGKLGRFLSPTSKGTGTRRT